MKCSNCGDSSGVVAIDGSTSLCSKCENVAFDQNEDLAFASQSNPAKRNRRPPTRFENNGESDSPRQSLKDVTILKQAASAKQNQCHGCKSTTKQNISCVRCDKLYCSKCSGLSINEMKVFVSHKAAFWACDPCSNPALEAIKTEKAIADQCKLLFDNYSKRFDEKIDNISNELEKMKSDVVQVKSKIQAIETKPKDRIVGHVDETTIKEMQERDSRKLNAIIFNLKEPETNVKYDRDQSDRSSIINIASKCDVTLESDNIKHVARLGKKQSDVNRVVLVSFDHEDTKKNNFSEI